MVGAGAVRRGGAGRSSPRRPTSTCRSWTGPGTLPVLRAAASVSTDLHDWDGENDYHRPFARIADLVFVSDTRLGERGRQGGGGAGAAHGAGHRRGGGRCYTPACHRRTCPPPPRPDRWWTPTVPGTRSRPG
ncbi:hypothetical protein V2I01_03455 [Micromonospora sp. BRA006-A]|nr:hypothetical protein [Micromonospora sp. BRA006-A]